MNDMILLKQGEIVLKGLNRRRFEQCLINNVTRRLKPYGQFRVYAIQSTVYIEPQNDSCDLDGAFDAMKTVFGIVALSRAVACEKDAAAIAQKAIEYLGDAMAAAKSFKVETRRSDKAFPMTSIQLSQYVGGELNEAFPHVPVDVHTPDFVVHVEVRDLAAYVHSRPVPGAGGIDSPVSSYMIAKRGVRLIPVHFFSFPYTSEAAKEKVIELAQTLTDYCGKMRLCIVPFTHIQEEIRDHCPEEYFTIIMRRFMMRIADRIASDNDCDAIVTGENLGQVASQTMRAMAVTESVTNVPVLRPLVGFDKEEIIRTARKIGTFETSILPYEDCCTVFTPRHPELRPTVAHAEEAESALDIDALVEEAIRGMEHIKLKVGDSL